MRQGPSLHEMSLYFHIPFCRRKCDYCHFYVLPDKEADKERLWQGFVKELLLLYPFLKGKQVVSLYFGGGTPSLFGPHRLSTLIDTIKRLCNLIPTAEITLEGNPEDIEVDRMRHYADAGVNRVSLGVQTLDGELLQLLGRRHSPQTALRAVDTVFRAGIDNLSIDLMYDLPNQTFAHWNATLQALEGLPLSHLSLYNLTIEPHTPFFKRRGTLIPLLPDPEMSLVMYEHAISLLEQRGLVQYEISAFARPGREALHNTGYWMGRPFFGLGPSAFSYWEGRRYRHHAHLGRYCQQLEEGHLPIDFEERLDEGARRRELLVLQLRLLKGFIFSQWVSCHGPLDPITCEALHQLKNEGYLSWEEDVIRLTRKGILFYDTVASILI